MLLAADFVHSRAISQKPDLGEQMTKEGARRDPRDIQGLQADNKGPCYKGESQTGNAKNIIGT